MATTEPTLAEALGRAHESLLRDLRGLEDAVGPCSGGALSELIARLRATQANLTEHFHYEEQNGYLDAVRKREPRLERTVQHLAEEHRHLSQSLASLVEETRAANGLDKGLCDKVRTWVKRVRDHETRERELLEEAFNLDISAED